MCGPRLSANTRLPYTAGPGMPGPYRLDKLKSCPRGKVLLRAALLAYRRNFCYNTKAACFTTDGKALHTTAGGWPHYPKRGKDHAFYIDFPYRSQDCYAEFSGKKQYPPPWPVTGIRAFLIPWPKGSTACRSAFCCLYYTHPGTAVSLLGLFHFLARLISANQSLLLRAAAKRR